MKLLIDSGVESVKKLRKIISPRPVESVDIFTFVNVYIVLYYLYFRYIFCGDIYICTLNFQSFLFRKMNCFLYIFLSYKSF